MSKSKIGQACILCQKRFKKGDQVYLIQGYKGSAGGTRFLCYPMCTTCAEEHPTEYTYLSYLIYVGGVGR